MLGPALKTAEAFCKLRQCSPSFLSLNLAKLQTEEYPNQYILPDPSVPWFLEDCLVCDSMLCCYKYFAPCRQPRTGSDSSEALSLSLSLSFSNPKLAYHYPSYLESYMSFPSPPPRRVLHTPYCSAQLDTTTIPWDLSVI